jgi:hypothetical protein
MDSVYENLTTKLAVDRGVGANSGREFRYAVQRPLEPFSRVHPARLDQDLCNDDGGIVHQNCTALAERG